jgi:hypothetical protein
LGIAWSVYGVGFGIPEIKLTYGLLQREEEFSPNKLGIDEAVRQLRIWQGIDERRTCPERLPSKRLV